MEPVPEPVRRDFVLAHPGEPGRAIRGRVVAPARAPAGGAPAVLVVHGFKGFLAWGFFPELHRRLAARGIAAVAFNMSGSGVAHQDADTFADGAAFEANTYTRELEDLGSVRAEVERGAFAGIDPRRIAVLGHSRGGAIALLHAAEQPGLRAAVTWAAIDRVDRWDPREVAAWRREGVLLQPNARTGEIHRLGLGLLDDAERNAARLDVVAACRRLALPVLLLHGDQDESVPPSALARLAAALPPGLGERELVRGAGHTFGATHPLTAIPPALEHVLERSIDFLARRLA